MGLYTDINVYDFDFTPFLPMGVIIDYSEGNNILLDTFISKARANVPVRTGNLMSSITGNIEEDGTCMLQTECEYAQYVEYGTWKAPAQPYFENAVEEAVQKAGESWYKALKNGINYGLEIAQQDAQEARFLIQQQGILLRKECYGMGKWMFEFWCDYAAERYNTMIELGGNVGAAQAEHDSIIRIAFEAKNLWEDIGDELKETYFDKADEIYNTMMDLAFEMANFFEDMAKTPKPNETIII